MKKRLKNKLAKKEIILKNTDPTEIARHLVTVLNDQGYSTKSWDNIENYHSINIMIHNGIDSPLKIENMAQKWVLKEGRPEKPIMWKPKFDGDLPF